MLHLNDRELDDFIVEHSKVVPVQYVVSVTGLREYCFEIEKEVRDPTLLYKDSFIYQADSDERVNMVQDEQLDDLIYHYDNMGLITQREKGKIIISNPDKELGELPENMVEDQIIKLCKIYGEEPREFIHLLGSLYELGNKDMYPGFASKDVIHWLSNTRETKDSSDIYSSLRAFVFKGSK